MPRLLQEIARYVDKQLKQNFLKMLLTKDNRIACIDGYHRWIAALVSAFQASFSPIHLASLILRMISILQIAALLDAQRWQRQSDLARAEDQQKLNEHLWENQKELIKEMRKVNSADSRFFADRPLSESQRSEFASMIVAIQ